MKSLVNLIKENTNTSSLNKEDIKYINKELFNSGEHSGFRKGTDILKINIKNLEGKIKSYYDYNISKETLELIKKENVDEVLSIFGVGYDGTWGFVIFTSTKPYKFIIIKNKRESELYQEEDSKDALDKILDFCK